MISIPYLVCRGARCHFVSRPHSSRTYGACRARVTGSTHASQSGRSTGRTYAACSAPEKRTFAVPAGDRNPANDQSGDVVDGWRALGIKPNERLTLSMLMRAPGSGLQEFNIRDRGDRRVVELCAYWHPAGFWGLLYWYAHLPLYSPLVNGAVAAVARRAEAFDDERAAAA